MENDDSSKTVSNYWSRRGLGQTILDALVAAGRPLDALTVEDLAPMDQFHSGGMGATTGLAELAEIPRGARVLDVGGGLGGPARTLASRFGCQVTVIDLTESYMEAAKILTDRIGLGDQVVHYVGNALELSFDDGAFDVVWTQQSGMNIQNKEALYQGIHRVLAPGGTLVFQEYMAGPVQPPIFPVMWARDGATSFLRTPDEMRSVIESVGFRARLWQDVTAETAAPSARDQPQSIAAIIMGENLPAIRLAGKRNDDEGRLLRVRAVFERL